MSKRNGLVLISLILAGESIFFLPFVLVRVFRPTVLASYDIDNLDIGSYFAVYGIVAMISYGLGGPLADRYPARNLMSTALILTGLGGFWMAAFPEGNVIRLIYGFWGFTTIILFWASLIRSTREWGGQGFQGRAFGLLEGGRGLAAALIASVALMFFSADQTATAHRYSNIVLGTSIWNILLGFWILYIIPGKVIAGNTISWANVKSLAANSGIWKMALVILCAYVGYKITDDISLYANEVLSFDEEGAAGVGTAALWMRPLFAVMAGMVADRWNPVKTIRLCFAFVLIGALLVWSQWLSTGTGTALLTLFITVIGVYGIRGIYFAIFGESGVELKATGTAVGIVSVLGFTPDIFVSPVMGYLLDNNAAELGHAYVFLFLSAFAGIGLLTSLFMRS